MTATVHFDTFSYLCWQWAYGYSPATIICGWKWL